MIGRIESALRRLPLRVKLLLIAAILMSGLFLANNFVQYIVLKQWMMNLEKASIQETMAELQDHFVNSGILDDPLVLDRHKRFIESINRNNQLIRVLDAQGKPLLAVTDGIPEKLIPPMAAARARLSFEERGGERLLEFRSPLNTAQFQGTIEIADSLNMFGKYQDAILLVMLIGGAAAVGVSGLGGWRVAMQLLRPVQSLAETMKRAKEHGWQERVVIPDNSDELSQLAGLFNGLMDRVEASFLQQKQFVEDASHELKTPIAIIEGHLSMLERWGKRDPAILEESLQTSLHQLARLKGIMQELLDLTRAEASIELSSVKPIRIREIVERAVAGLRVPYPDFRCDSDVSGLDRTLVRIEQRHLEQILHILLDNAVQYSEDCKHIAVRGWEEDGRAHLRIQDQGIGIEAEHLPHVFERFYRADPARSRERGGTGLGLPIAKRLVEKYGGEIRLSSKPGEGTEAFVSFPSAAPIAD